MSSTTTSRIVKRPMSSSTLDFPAEKHQENARRWYKTTLRDSGTLHGFFNFCRQKLQPSRGSNFVTQVERLFLEDT
ncbi:hypothetical protein TNCT_230661 [Trichonephila clavata]|uniref:Uncharacterized protein n=1 Tax=Trichonephila clavata TaxID=2740835 RepID=A0A8X6HRS8_TRICU|nr:hypothetical protein TNCT_230661 [Trichonephila clavata]